MPVVGTLKLPLNRRQYFLVTGGPFVECPVTMKGVKMAKEVDRPCFVDIPTPDFQTPDRLVLYRGLHKAMDAILAGEPVYVGCMAGKGRTGLFLSVLAKAFGVKKPVEYVREHYYSHAVETKEQYAFVRRFTITPTLKRKVKLARRRARYHFWKVNFWRKNLTRMPTKKRVLAAEEFLRWRQGDWIKQKSVTTITTKP